MELRSARHPAQREEVPGGRSGDEAGRMRGAEGDAALLERAESARPHSEETAALHAAGWLSDGFGHDAGMDMRVEPDPAAWAAGSISARLAAATRARGHAHLAVSGGSTARAMLRALAARDVDWGAVDVWQVDERVAPDGDADRNANQLDGFPGAVHLMPVTDPDLPGAAVRYAGELPERIDVVHLGMGEDGHTASWPPGDPVVHATGLVALSQEYQGRIRMTLTPHAVNAAGSRVVLVTGEHKAVALAGWSARDRTLPITEVRRSRTVVVVDPALARAVRAVGGA